MRPICSPQPSQCILQQDSTDANRSTPLCWTSKAFDKVPHQRLAAKLHHCGIRDQTLSWNNSFLADRSQQVVLDGKSSSSGSSHFWCSSGDSARSSPILGVHQRPALKGFLVSTTIRRWLSPVQSDPRQPRRKVVALRKHAYSNV